MSCLGLKTLIFICLSSMIGPSDCAFAISLATDFAQDSFLLVAPF